MTPAEREAWHTEIDAELEGLRRRARRAVILRLGATIAGGAAGFSLLGGVAQMAALHQPFNWPDAWLRAGLWTACSLASLGLVFGGFWLWDHRPARAPR